MATRHEKAGLLLGPDIGRLLVRLGIAGMVLGILATIIAWLLVDGAVDSLGDSLGLTDEALVAVAETIDVADGALESSADGLDAVRSVVDDLDRALEATGSVLTEADIVLGETIPNGIDAIRAPLPGLISSTRTIGDVLAGLSLLGVDFQLETPPEESLSRIDTALDDLSTRLRSPGARLGRVGEEFSTLRADLSRIGIRLGELVESVEQANQVISSYEVTSEGAVALVDDAVADLSGRRTLARTLVVVLGGIVVVGQSVPIALGRRLRARPELLEKDS